jgi:adenine-specific DNA-methyltransferase
VLDPYLGSGTTSATAHKLGRRWIGIEQGEHAVTHCAQRMWMVIDGEPGGISAEVEWAGGGGMEFRRHHSSPHAAQPLAA